MTDTTPALARFLELRRDTDRVIAMQSATIERCAKIQRKDMNMTLADTFATLCAKHDLSTLSVAIMRIGDDRRIVYHSYAHWGNGRTCASGNGEAPELAIADAIAEANKKRAVAVDVPALVMGAMAA